MQRLQDFEEQFAKVSGGLLLGLYGRVTPASACWATAPKTDPTPPSKWKWIMIGPTPSALAASQAEPVCADALDQLGGGGDDRRFGQAGAGSGLQFFLSIWTRGLLFGYGDDGHDDARDEQGKEANRANR